MKTIKFTLISPWLLGFLVLFSLLWCGCADKPIEPFDLIIVISDKIGDNNNSPIPNTLIQLTYPLEVCEKVNYLPQTKVIRLNTQRAEMPLLVDLKSFAGRKNNTRFITRKLKTALEKKSIGTVFSVPNPKGYNANGELLAFLRTKGKRATILYFADNGYEEEDYEGNKVFFDLDSLRKVINEPLCDGQKKSFIIVYNPPEYPVRVIVPPVEEGETVVLPETRVLKAALLKLGSNDFSPAKRRAMVEPTYSQFFTDRAIIKEIGANGTVVDIVNARKYLLYLASIRTLEDLIIKGKKQDISNGKYWEVELYEKHQISIQ